MLTLPAYFWLVPIASLLTLIFTWYFYRTTLAHSEGTDRMKEIAGYVKEGAKAYLKRQYKVVTIVFAVLLVILSLLAIIGIQNPFVPIAFLTGGFFSGLCGFIGMRIATEASPRTAWAASSSLNKGLQVSFRAGAVMGLVVVGLGLLDIAIWYFMLTWMYDSNVLGLGASLVDKIGLTGGFAEVSLSPEFQRAKLVEITTTMLTFGMGASTQALFARVGGGIFTKAADVGADLVGKVEAGIPEDDPRNPATIADNVGDNVGDVAGMGADLYESYCGCILATSAIGASVGLHYAANESSAVPLNYVLAPMLVAAIGSILSILGIFMVKTKESATQRDLLRSLNIGVILPSVLILIAIFILMPLLDLPIGIGFAVLAGLLTGIIIGNSTAYYTSNSFKPTLGITKAAKMGSATTIIEGISVGMMSAAIPGITIGAAIFAAFAMAGGYTSFTLGLYGVSFAAVGMLSTLGVTLATDAYGPIADNAGGNAEMSGLGAEVRKRTDSLDILGNTTAATGKGFAIGSAALTALALLAAYAEEIRLWIGKLAHQAPEGIFKIGTFSFTANPEIADQGNALLASQVTLTQLAEAFDLKILNPNFIIGLFLGSMAAFVFCAMTMQAVGRAAQLMVGEVRRQFKEIKGILTGEGKPDYAACVLISTQGAQREMILPSILALALPVIVGLLLGVAGVFGLLTGALSTGFSLAVMLNNAGGAWDNAKKYIEEGHLGGKGSEAHKACVVGDTIGDPFKDTSGPSLNILIKLMSMVSVVFAGLVVAKGNLLSIIFGG